MFLECPIQFEEPFSHYYLKNDSFQGAKLIYGGAALLCATERNSIDIYCVSSNDVLYYPVENQDECFQIDQPLRYYDSIQLGDSIHDFSCYQNHSNYFITSVRNHPVQLFSIESKSAVSTYIVHNQFDELDESFSVNCNPSNDKIYSGGIGKFR
jgi:hypothetical protein